MLLLLGVTAAVYASSEKKKFVLVIDAGHGGKDYGAVGKITNEKTINLNIALEFGRLVETNCPDVRVIYTRKTDKFVTLQRRADIANENHADLFVSVHTNALPKGKIAYGTETYTLGIARAEANLEVAKRENSVITYEADYQTTYQGFDPNKPESYIIFELMQDIYMEQSVEMARCIQQQYTHYAGRKNKGVKQAGFLVLRATSMPSVLTEVGFISTPAEERYLNTKAGVAALARSLYNGFLNYKGQVGKSAADPVADGGSAERKEEAENATTPVQPVAEKKRENGTRPEGTAGAEGKESRPVFKVQILTASKLLRAGDKRFKGVAPVEHYKENGVYKYTYGSSNNYNEVRRMMKKVAAKFPGLFIVAFRDGERMDVQEAIRIFKNQ